jgi:hypothetical protein
LPAMGWPTIDEHGAGREVEAVFQDMLSGIRRLPRRQRAAALRAAREWRFLEMKALRDKRARERRGRYLALRQLRQTRIPAPE